MMHDIPMCGGLTETFSNGPLTRQICRFAAHIVYEKRSIHSEQMTEEKQMYRTKPKVKMPEKRFKSSLYDTVNCNLEFVYLHALLFDLVLALLPSCAFCILRRHT